MKIYDISQPLDEAEVYELDTPPKVTLVRDLLGGDVCNLSDFSCCLHNGTHIDAPFHFIADGQKVDQMNCDLFYGSARVAPLERLKSINFDTCGGRLLLRAKRQLTHTEATLIAESDIKLIGVECQSVGNAAVHRLLLGKGIAVLEGIRLNGVPDGYYTLCAFPLKIASDGAPVRAVLIDE